MSEDPIPPTRPAASRWLREPLLHFVAAGAILFALDLAIASRQEDPNVITLGAAADAELRKLHETAKGVAPTEEELAVLRQRWLDNELLYREGLALGLDRGDSGIRERVIFKALNVVSSNLTLPTPTDEELRSWFETQRARYDEPPRIDFLEAVIEGRPDLAAAAAFADALNRGSAADVESGLRVYKGRPVATLAPAFGPGFAERLAALPLNTWQAVDSPAGPRAVRVEARTAGAAADFEALRETVRQDWRDRRMAELRTEAVRGLAAKYTLRVAGEQP